MSKRCKKCVPAGDRRNFLKFGLTTASLAAAPALAAAQQQGKRRGPGSTVAKDRKDEAPKKGTHKAMILLWMGGGPTQLDTWDPKPGKSTGGKFKAINTTGDNMKISEHLPICATQGKHLSIIRSMYTREGAHERGTALMHTGTRPVPGLSMPPIGTVASYELGEKNFPLPHFITLSPPQIPQSSLFGEEYLPFRLKNANDPIPNINGRVDENRSALLNDQNKEWETEREQPETRKLSKALVKAEDVMTTPLLKAFDYRSDKKSGEYGGRFGTNCLLARRLVEAGVSFVEIGLGGWDMHGGVFTSCERKLPELDRGMGTLIKDLAEKDMLKDTVVVWMGEFGRTPNINARQGRDHWTRGFSVVMAGGNLAGGRVYGDTGPEGRGIAKDQVVIQDFYATLYHALGIDYNKHYVTSGRKVKYAYGKPMGKHIAELF